MYFLCIFRSQAFKSEVNDLCSIFKLTRYCMLICAVSVHTLAMPDKALKCTLGKMCLNLFNFSSSIVMSSHLYYICSCQICNKFTTSVKWYLTRENKKCMLIVSSGT